MSLIPTHRLPRARLLVMVVTLAIDDTIDNLPDFMSNNASQCDEIRIKYLANSWVIERYITPPHRMVNAIRKAIESSHIATTSFLLGFSIEKDSVTDDLPAAWGSPSDYPSWFDDIHSRMQRLLPPQEKYPGHTFKIGLFREEQKELCWSFQPPLEAEGRNILLD